MVYALHESERDAMRASVVTRALAIDGVEHVMWLARDAHDVPREGIIASRLHGELRFCPGGAVEDPRGVCWSIEGSLEVIDAAIEDARLTDPLLPRRPRPRLVGAHLSDLRRGPVVGATGL